MWGIELGNEGQVHIDGGLLIVSLWLYRRSQPLLTLFFLWPGRNGGTAMVKEIIFPAESGGAGPTRFVVEDEKRGMLWVREYHPRHGKNRKLQPMTPRRWKQLQREADRGLASTPRLASIDEYKRLLKVK